MADLVVLPALLLHLPSLPNVNDGFLKADIIIPLLTQFLERLLYLVNDRLDILVVFRVRVRSHLLFERGVGLVGFDVELLNALPNNAFDPDCKRFLSLGSEFRRELPGGQGFRDDTLHLDLVLRHLLHIGMVYNGEGAILLNMIIFVAAWRSLFLLKRSGILGCSCNNLGLNLACLGLAFCLFDLEPPLYLDLTVYLAFLTSRHGLAGGK